MGPRQEVKGRGPGLQVLRSDEIPWGRGHHRGGGGTDGRHPVWSPL